MSQSGRISPASMDYAVNRSFIQMFARLPTGTKMLLILSAAMLPLSLIALLTSVDMAQSARAERLTAAQTTTALYASRIDSVVSRGLDAVRVARVTMQSPPELCAAWGRQNRLNPTGRPPMALFTREGHKICQSHGPPIPNVAPAHPQVDHVWLDAPRRLFRFTGSRPDGNALAESDISISNLPIAVVGEHGIVPTRLALLQGTSEVVLLDHTREGEASPLVMSQPVADGRLALIAEYPRSSVNARMVLLVMLPILMWAAAAFTSWYIINRLLLSPLGRIRQSIDTWEVNRGAFTLPRLTTPSHEIRDLAESFASVADRIHSHENDLEEGLARQMKLTREVHHRVKNNLQVVSSLINLHARGTDGDVAAAYAAIQRRVDALAVVHRNHYAELEENRGVSMRALAGELAASLRASAPAAASGMPISINMIDAYVTQDIAVPVAFMITEVVELLMDRNPGGSVLISLEATDRSDRAALRIETVGIAPGALDEYAAIVRFERVVTGLARQFRAPLMQDRDAGKFEIEIAIHA